MSNILTALKTLPIHPVKGLDGVFVRVLTGAERTILLEHIRQAPDIFTGQAALVALALCDKDGKSVYDLSPEKIKESIADAQRINNLFIGDIATAAQDLNKIGIVDDKKEEDRKKSSETPTP